MSLITVRASAAAASASFRTGGWGGYAARAGAAVAAPPPAWTPRRPETARGSIDPLGPGCLAIGTLARLVRGRVLVDRCNRIAPLRRRLKRDPSVAGEEELRPSVSLAGRDGEHPIADG